jgi:hypothetical protein
MHVSVPELDVQQAGLTSISVGQVGIGPITVGELMASPRPSARRTTSTWGVWICC